MYLVNKSILNFKIGLHIVRQGTTSLYAPVLGSLSCSLGWNLSPWRVSVLSNRFQKGRYPQILLEINQLYNSSEKIY